MTGPPTSADLTADLGKLVVSCLDCYHDATMPVAALLYSNFWSSLLLRGGFHNSLATLPATRKMHAA
jgi:hypothetical protein